MKSTTSAAIFIRYLILGVIGCLIGILAVKLTLGASAYAGIVTAIVIFVVNLFAVLGFTNIVLKNPEYLAEPDSPDYAYYLGFSLTVATLALTFFSDSIQQTISSGSIEEIAAQGSNTVRSSLSQFAAGLTATFVGLSCRIYLSSLQNIEEKEPEELIRELRIEVSSFQLALQESALAHRATVAEAQSALAESTQSMSAAIIRFVNKLDSSCNSLDSAFDEVALNRVVDSFSRSLAGLSTQVSKFATEFNSIDSIKSAASDYHSSIANLTQNTDTLVSSLKNTGEVIDNSLNVSIGQALNSFDALKISVDASVQKLDQVLIGSVSRLSDGINQVNFSGVSIQIDEFSRSIAALKSTVDQMTVAIKATQQGQSNSFFGQS